MKEDRKLAEQTTEEKTKTLKKKLTLIAVSLKNATNQLDNGKVIGATTIDDLITQQEDLRKEIIRLESGEKEKPSEEKESEPEDPEKFTDRFKVKRRAYTHSAASIEQRQANAKKASKKMQERGSATGPTSTEGKAASSRNAFKHGAYASSFFHSFRKPCQSTCDKYPCSLIVGGDTEPGQDCLDKQHVYETWNSIMQAVEDSDYDDFNSLIALSTAKNIEIVREIQQALLEDGVTLRSDIFDGFGKKIGDKLVQHPNLSILPKLIEQLGLTPRELMITPKALISTDQEKKKEKSVLDLMTEASNNLKSIKENKE